MACVRVGAASTFSSPRRSSPYARPLRPSNGSSSSSSSSSSRSCSSPSRRRRLQKSLSVDLTYAPARAAEADFISTTAAAAYPFSAPVLSSSPFPWPNSPTLPHQSSPPLPPAELSPAYTLITPHLAIADLDFAENEEQLRRAGVTHVVSVVGDRVHIPAHIPPSHRLHVPLADAPFEELVGALRPVVSWVGDVLRAAGVVPDPSLEEEERPGEGEAKDVRILVHCAQGISRSPAVSAALLVALPLVSEGDDDAAPVSSPAVSRSPDTQESTHDSVPVAVDPNTPDPRDGMAASGSGVSPREPPRRALSAPAALAYITARRPVADPNWGFRAQLGEWEKVCRAESSSFLE